MVCGNLTAVCGWSEIFNGDLIGGAFTMYDNAWLYFVVLILFLVYQIMLYMKTKNLTLAWITGAFFASLYATSSFVRSTSVNIIGIILVFELAGILFLLVFKRK